MDLYKLLMIVGKIVSHSACTFAPKLVLVSWPFLATIHFKMWDKFSKMLRSRDCGSQFVKICSANICQKTIEFFVLYKAVRCLVGITHQGPWRSTFDGSQTIAFLPLFCDVFRVPEIKSLSFGSSQCTWVRWFGYTSRVFSAERQNIFPKIVSFCPKIFNLSHMISKVSGRNKAFLSTKNGLVSRA